ncbi:hypothetical protein [Sphingobacterium sp. 18053]|uniref:hypothetical protein n=1 Tax=Sphingobacterium sp. 18053 TaxID=2681401 RepID=UPI0013575726|nr:hypothetical protein [Sphingobacterium sp. 18053]
MRPLKTIAILFSFFLITTSCKKDPSPQKEKAKPLKGDHGMPIGNAVTKIIGPSGGSITSPDGKISLEIPPGAVNSNTQFVIQPITKTLETATGPAYRLSPEHVTFQKDIKIEMKYTEEDLLGTNEDFLYLTSQNQEGFFYRSVLTNIDKATNTLWTNTRHFSDWYIERIFTVVSNKKLLEANEEAAILLFFTETFPDGQLKTGEAEKINNVSWFVNGPGEVKGIENTGPYQTLVKAVYKAPASIPEPKIIAVGGQIKNMISKTHPDRPGTSGLVIVQTEISLQAQEFFTWELGGAKHIALSFDAGLLGNKTMLIGTGLTGGINIDLNASKPGEYEIGPPNESDKYSIVAFLSGSTQVIYQGNYYRCNESNVKYGKGKLVIEKYGNMGGFISGSIEATVYEIGCDPKSKKLKGSFKMKRKM